VLGRSSGLRREEGNVSERRYYMYIRYENILLYYFRGPLKVSPVYLKLKNVTQISLGYGGLQ
jgi:hypothetical protein